MKNISDLVVVITGASSGIGRATAHELARRGARLVLAARRGDALEEAAAECRRLGGRALAVPTDVTDERAVERLASAAEEKFGRIDVWINDAGVGLYARLDEAPASVHRRVLETNVFGPLYGSRAAVRRFRAQGHGHVVNVASVLGTAAFPYNTAYAASKFAVRGFTEALRQELLGTGVEVSTIMPAAIDTPFFQHAGNYMGKGVKPPSPVYAPERVAQTIVSCIERPRAEAFVGGSARAISGLHALLGPVFDPIARALTDADHFQERPAGETQGALFRPMSEGRQVRGGWGSGRTRRAPKAGLALLAVAGASALVWALSRRASAPQKTARPQPVPGPAAV